MHHSQGVSMLELMMTLGIVAIIATLAAPSFRGMQQDSERANAVNSFLHALFFARSEAIKRGQVISLCRSTDGSICAHGSNAAWHHGWLVFVNIDRDEPPQRDPGEPVLLVNQGWPRGTITSNRNAYSFRPHTQTVVNGTIVFCDARGSRHARAIIISHTGRPRVSQLDSSGRPLPCPAG